jgi:hypothetical protein
VDRGLSRWHATPALDEPFELSRNSGDCVTLRHFNGL